MPNIFSFNQFFTYQATNPDVLAKRDSSVEEDPYAAYYEQYTNAVHTQGLTEKQGFAGTMENVFGDDAAVIIKILAIIQFMIIFFLLVTILENISILNKYYHDSSYLELLVP